MDHVKHVDVALDKKLATLQVEAASSDDARSMLPSLVEAVKVKHCTLFIDFVVVACNFMSSKFHARYRVLLISHVTIPLATHDPLPTCVFWHRGVEPCKYHFSTS